jgi:3alpha(or 20beta)-hydroxysteroid dehydrogenase
MEGPVVNMHGKVVVITGAASGQGAAEAALFVEHGVRHDVSNESSWSVVRRQALDRFKRVDALINNAGVYQPAKLLDTDMAVWDQHYRVNQLGVFLGMRTMAEAMTGGSGTIVNVSSNAGLNNVPGIFAYASSKWAVRGMTKLAASELAPLGIRVNSIHPGLIDTTMLWKNSPESMKTYEDMIPMGRLGEAEEVARLALFLASEASSYLTGAEVTVDGGIG